MISSPEADPRVRALAELLHQLRPEWHRPGIAAGLRAAAERHSIETLIRAAIDAALDPSAWTPAVIVHRAGDTWQLPGMTRTETRNLPPRAPSGTPPATVANLPAPGDYDRGVAAARAEMAAAKDRPSGGAT